MRNSDYLFCVRGMATRRGTGLAGGRRLAKGVPVKKERQKQFYCVSALEIVSFATFADVLERFMT